MPQIKQQKNQEATLTVIELRKALKIYENKVGTYEISIWKNTNERKVASAVRIISSLISNYDMYGNLTPAQIKLAKKLINNSKKLV